MTYDLTYPPLSPFVRETSPMAGHGRQKRRNHGWSADRAAHHRRDRAGAAEGRRGGRDPRADRADSPRPPPAWAPLTAPAVLATRKICLGYGRAGWVARGP